MTNRVNVEDFAGAVDAVLQDVVAAYPRDRRDWMRDSKRVHHGSRNRGPEFFTLDLPQHADALMRGLADGRLSIPIQLPYGSLKSGYQVPKLFSGLWLRVFSGEGLLRADADPNAVFFLLTLTSLWKKVEIECHQHRITAVYEDYFRVDELLPPSHVMWDDPDLVSRENAGQLSDGIVTFWGSDDGVQNVSERASRALWFIQDIADKLVSDLGQFDPEMILGRHGPGAVSDLTWTSSKYEFPSWPEKLEKVFPIADHGVLNYGQDIGSTFPKLQWNSLGIDEPSSYLTHVPKTAKGPRLIAEEPTCHQYMQQGVANELRRRVQATKLGRSIDFFDQNPSQDDCFKSSKSGTRATIDLSSASDRLSTWTVQRIFRSNLSLLRMLVATRTRFVAQDALKKVGPLHRLRKYASMGSALTFPVQSIVFAIICAGVGAAYEPRLYRNRNPKSLLKNVRVYGDDLIVPVDWVPLLEEVLNFLCLKVNADKSFSEGNFRESCGVFAFRGHDVTPARIRTPLGGTDGRSVRAWLDTTTNSFIKGLWNLSSWLERKSPQGFKPPAVDRRAAPLGLPTNSVGIDPTLKKGWDLALQKHVYVVDDLLMRPLQRRGLDGTNSLTHLRNVSYTDRTQYEGLFEHELPRSSDWVSVADGPRGDSRTAIVRRVRVGLDKISS